MMVGPRHVTRKAKWEKLPAQLHTRIAAVLVETLTGKKKKHGGWTLIRFSIRFRVHPVTFNIVFTNFFIYRRKGNLYK